ncbi:MAG: hypothetical protein QOE23_1571, partial [Pseudonocardiales bacterium]|nr:hypothetical protein [Pseudonocardiales bacterium]
QPAGDPNQAGYHPYQQGYPPPSGPYAPDVYLANPYLPPPPRKAGPGKKIIAGVAVAAVLAGGAVAAYAYSMLASSGVQPERVLPATTVAFAKLDLDPAAGQKIAAYRLSSKFPAISHGAGNLDQEKHALLTQFLDEQTDLNYDTDVKPWLGDRAAIAAVPDAGGDKGFDPVLALAYTDESKMKAALSKAARTATDFGYVTLDGYALISDSQQHAEAVLAGTKRATLAGNDHYKSDLKSLHGDQLAVGWADLAASVAAMRSGISARTQLKPDELAQLDKLAAKGRIVLGAHASSDYLEVTALSHQAATAGSARSGGKPVTGTLAGLGADTSAALEISGLGDSLSQTWDQAAAALGLNQDFQEIIDETGLKLPDDLKALFGTDITVSVKFPHGMTADPAIAAQVSTSGADRALQLLGSLGEPFGFSSETLHPRRTADGYLISTSPDYDPRPTAGTPTLGDDPAFQKAVPDRAQASLIGYVNLGALLDSDPETSAKDKADWKHVGSLGLSAVTTSDGGRMTLRFTTR